MPVYNEAATIRQVIERVKAVPLPKELIIVDDASTDGTSRLLDRLATSPADARNGIKVVHQGKNQGKGAAIRTGIQHATGDVVIIQDADMEYDPSEYPRLLEPILNGDADVVYGSRFIGDRRRVHLFWHSLGNRILTIFSNICTNLNLTDMETCYKVFKAEIIKSLPLRSNRFGFEPEVTAKVAKLRCNVYEVPISYKGRGYSEGKKIDWKDGISALWTIFKFWLLDDLYEQTAGLRTLRILEGAGLYNKWLFEQCRSSLGKRVLEAGAGVGNITKYLTNRELVVGTDVIDFYLDELKRKFQHYPNVSVERFDLLDDRAARDLKERYRPDSVLSINVLDHIEDDQAALSHINRVLDVGGTFVCLVPAHPVLFCRMDKNLGHFRRYGKKSIAGKLRESGFEVETARYLNFIGAVGWFVNGRLLRRKLIPSNQLRTFDFLVWVLSVEKIVSPPFGLSVLAVAKKSREV